MDILTAPNSSFFYVNIDNTTYKTANFTGNNDTEIIGTGSTVNVLFNFNYSAIYRTAYPDGMGTCSLNLLNMNFKKKEVKPDDGVHYFVGLLSGLVTVDCNLVTGTIDANLLNYFDKAKQNANFPQFPSNISLSLQTFVNTYYDTQAKARPASFPLETYNPDVNLTLGLGFFQAPKYDPTGITYYYAGNVTSSSTNKGFLKEEPKILNDFIFNATNGPYQIFLTYGFVGQVLSNLGSSNNFNFTLNSSTIPADFSFDLYINDLGKIVPGIYAAYPRDNDIVVVGTLSNFLSNDDGSVQNCTILFNVTDIYGNPLFGWQTLFNLNVVSVYDVTNQKLNYKFSNGNVLSNRVTFNPYGYVDVGYLNGLVNSNIQTYLKESTWKLLKNDINLSPFFQTVQRHVVLSNGDLFGGPMPTTSTPEDAFFNNFHVDSFK